jgi:hypothetical protein
VDISTIPGAKEVVFGSIPVSSENAKVLFDPSASHSFIFHLLQVVMYYGYYKNWLAPAVVVECDHGHDPSKLSYL